MGSLTEVQASFMAIPLSQVSEYCDYGMSHHAWLDMFPPFNLVPPRACKCCWVTANATESMWEGSTQRSGMEEVNLVIEKFYKQALCGSLSAWWVCQRKVLHRTLRACMASLKQRRWSSRRA